VDYKQKLRGLKWTKDPLTNWSKCCITERNGLKERSTDWTDTDPIGNDDVLLSVVAGTYRR